MRGHIVAEERFLHQGIDHHLFVTGIENEENEFRFEVTRIPPGGDHAEVVFEKLVNFSERLPLNVPIEQFIATELTIVKRTVFGDEDLHVHDP